MSAAVYASDPDAAPDEEFAPGRLEHLVAGNRGRLLDARRTPLSVTEVIPDRAEFVVQIDAFEDRGARWRLPVWEVERMQFPVGAEVAPADHVAELRQAADRFNREMIVPAEVDVAAQTFRRITRVRADAQEVLAEMRGTIDLADHVSRRQGDPRLYERLDEFLATRGLSELDRRFCDTLVSNPGSGEVVKGHAIVLAELGLCRFRGAVVRDPALFDGGWSRARRAEHLIARIAFTRELWEAIGGGGVTLYRAAAVDGPLPAPKPVSFVACTFSEPVAAAHFAGGPTTRTAVMWRQVVDPHRLLMTFLETAAMNAGFREAEAVLIAEPANLAF